MRPGFGKKLGKGVRSVPSSEAPPRSFVASGGAAVDDTGDDAPVEQLRALSLVSVVITETVLLLSSLLFYSNNA